MPHSPAHSAHMSPLRVRCLQRAPPAPGMCKSEHELYWTFLYLPLVEFSLWFSWSYRNWTLCSFFFKCFCFLINLFKSRISLLNTALPVPHKFWHMMIPLTQRCRGLFFWFWLWFIVCWFPKKKKEILKLIVTFFNFIALWYRQQSAEYWLFRIN